MKRVLLLLLFCTLFAAQAATPPPDKLLPADTLAVITFPEYRKARNSLVEMPLSQLWADPAMKPFRDKFMGKLKSDVLTRLERELGLKFSEYSGLAQGQVTLALMPKPANAKPDEPPSLVLLVDTGSKSDLLRTNLAELKKKWIDSGKQLRLEKIRDVDFTALILSTDDLSKTWQKAFSDKPEKPEDPNTKKEASKVEWLIGQSGSLLLVGNSVSALEKVLVRQSGGGVPSLSEHPAYAAQYGPMFREALAYGWIDLKTIFEAAAKAAPSEESEPGSMLQLSGQKMLQALGLNGLQTLSVTLQNSREGMLVNLHLRVPQATRQGLFKILAFEPKEANPPPFVPADALKFSRYRVDIHKSFATFEKMLGEVQPGYANLLKKIIEYAGKDQDTQFDLRQQLIANLGDDIISFEKAPRQPTPDQLKSPPRLLLLSSPKPEQLAGAVKSMVSFIPLSVSGKVKEREFLGRKVYTLTLTSMGQDGKRKDDFYYYAASGGYVAFSSDQAMLEEYLRGPSSKTLAETAGLAEAAQKVGGMSTGLFGCENQRETMRFDILKGQAGGERGMFAGLFASLLGLKDNKLKEWLDYSLLPPYDQIAKYFYLDVWSGSLNNDGLTFKLFCPVPPQIRK